MHAEVLNFMMANTCHNESLVKNGDIVHTTFTFDLHCVEVSVVAKFVGDWGSNDARYEILSWTAKEI